MDDPSSLDTSWPRFTADSTPVQPPPRPGDDWGRFGSLPPRDPRRELIPPSAATTPAAAPAFEARPAPPVPPVPQSPTPPRMPALEPELIEVRRTPAPEPPRPAPTRALVPAYASPEVALSDVMHAARKALPVLAVAAVVTVGAMRFFRRR